MYCKAFTCLTCSILPLSSHCSDLRLKVLSTLKARNPDRVQSQKRHSRISPWRLRFNLRTQDFGNLRFFIFVKSNQLSELFSDKVKRYFAQKFPEPIE